MEQRLSAGEESPVDETLGRSNPHTNAATMRKARAFIDGVMTKVAAWECEQRNRPGGGLIGKATVRPGMQLVKVSGGVLDAQGKDRQLTEAGQMTERRRAPAALREFGHDHPYTIAAARYASLVERVGALRGIDMEADKGSVAKSDGGASARADELRELARIEAAIGDAVVLKTKRSKVIKGLVYGQLTVREILDGVVLKGYSLASMREATGRSPEGKRARRATKLALTDALQRISDLTKNV